MWTVSKIILASALLLGAAAAGAHDLWIEPATFAPRPGEPVALRLRVGQDLVGEPLPLIPQLVREFVAVDAQARRAPVANRPGADPAGVLRAAAPGALVIGYHSHPSRVVLEADKFNAYLAEEGLDAVIALRAERGETTMAVREQFARCAKSLLRVGGGVGGGVGAAGAADQTLGLPLELVAEADPDALGANGVLPLRLSYLGQPLAGALVVAMNSRDPADKQLQRSDRDGRVRFTLRAGGGLWLIKAVHMVAAPAGADADWSSYWASLTFETR